ncbi:MAG: TIGR03915 family putative DNA repair protein [Salinimicrobium sp.]
MNATVLSYDGGFEGFLCCVFAAYEQKLQPVKITAEDKAEAELFADVHTIATEPEKASRVWKAVESKASAKGKSALKMAFLSEQPGIELELYSMIKYILKNEQPVDRDFSHPAVLKVSQVARQVGREKHRMEAFVRFRLTKDEIYFAAIEPDFHVLPLLAGHFGKRYADQKWLIYDLKRQLGLFYDLEKMEYVSLTLDPEIGIAGASEAFFHSSELQFQKLWQEYFKSVNIKSRANSKLHQQHLPRRYWKYLTEKQPKL